MDQRYRLAGLAAQCLHDPCDSHKLKHHLLTLVRQRLFAMALGYENTNDAAWLVKDPALKIMAGKAPERAADLASQPTLSRFENRVISKDLRLLSYGLLKLYLKTPPGPRKAIVLGIIRSSFSTARTASTWPRGCAPAPPTPPRGRWRYSKG